MQGWSSWGIRTALRILNSRRISAWPRGTRWPAIAGRGARGRGIDVVFWVPSCRWLRARPSGTCRAAVTRRAAVGRTHDALVRSRQPLLVEQKLLVRRLATDIAVRPEKEAAHALPPHGGLDQQKYLGRIGKVSKNDRVILLVQVQPRAGVAAPVADHAQAPSVGVCGQSLGDVTGWKSIKSGQTPKWLESLETQQLPVPVQVHCTSSEAQGQRVFFRTDSQEKFARLRGHRNDPVMFAG